MLGSNSNESFSPLHPRRDCRCQSDHTFRNHMELSPDTLITTLCDDTLQHTPYDYIDFTEKQSQHPIKNTSYLNFSPLHQWRGCAFHAHQFARWHHPDRVSKRRSLLLCCDKLPNKSIPKRLYRKREEVEN